MSDENIELSRRKTLLGLGTVGVASIGAGMGTSAYFSDLEAFDGNTIQAGEFGLTVEQAVHDVDQDGIGPDEEEFDGGVGDSGVWVRDTIEIEDAKPGDTYEFCWDITVEENPGHVALAACYTDLTGAEADNVSVDDLWDVDDESDLSTVGDETQVDDVRLENGHDVTYEYDTVGDLLGDLETGALLDDGGDAIRFDPDDTWTLCIALHIPSEVGNELQGALLEWDLAFYAEQARHNDASGVADRAADSIVCGDEGEPECPDCEVPDPGEDDFDVTIESIDDSAFPTVEATARVDTEAGGAGDLEASDFQLCEETVGGLGHGYCGQEIEDVAFGGEQEETLADIMFVIDTSGSMSGSKIDNAKDGAITLVGGDTDTDNDANDGGFDPTVNVGLVEFSSSASLVSSLGTDQNDVEADIEGLGASGGTDVGDGIDEAQDEFDSSENNRDNAPDFMIVLGNGDTSGGESAATAAKNAGTTIYGIAYGSGAEVDDFSAISGEVPNDPDYEDYTFDADEDDITNIFDEIGQEIFGTYTLEYETANFATDGNDRNVLVYVDDPDEGDADATGSYTAPSS